MNEKNLHVSDETLLLHGSLDLHEKELSEKDQAKVRDHLLDCAHCRDRLNTFRKAMGEFADAYENGVSGGLGQATERRVALQLRLAEMKSAGNLRDSWLGRAGWMLRPRSGGYTIAVVVLVLVTVAALFHREITTRSQQISASIGLWTEPKTDVTPGATIPITASQVCSMRSGQRVPAIPASLQRKVFAMYGVSDAPQDAYEVDYLITPGLGGATDIRNLWPQPYYDTAWNARVKDQLEDRLQEMVCGGQLDLATAQQDISRDWIAAYRKYFHTELPVSNGAAARNQL